MAATEITNTVLKRNEAKAMPTAATVAKTDGALVTFDKDDQKILLLLKNNVSNATHTELSRLATAHVSDLEDTCRGRRVLCCC